MVEWTVVYLVASKAAMTVVWTADSRAAERAVTMVE